MRQTATTIKIPPSKLAVVTCSPPSVQAKTAPKTVASVRIKDKVKGNKYFCVIFITVKTPNVGIKTRYDKDRMDEKSPTPKDLL